MASRKGSSKKTQKGVKLRNSKTSPHADRKTSTTSATKDSDPTAQTLKGRNRES
jgi:hypothetical protein